MSLRKFVAVDYPGLVENESEAIRTLGGYDRIYQAFSRKNSKLLLNYTPDNILAKMICSVQIDEPESDEAEKVVEDAMDTSENGDNKSAEFMNNLGQLSKESNQLKNKNNDLILPCLVISVKTNKDNGQSKASVIGKVKKLFTFSKMADFQYLPMGNISTKLSSPTAPGVNNTSPKSGTETQFSYTAFYDSFLFNNIDNYQLELKENKLPNLFILPPFFSRFDDPINYAYRAEPSKKKPEESKKSTTSSKPMNGDSDEEDSNADEEERLSDEEETNDKDTEAIEDSSTLIRSRRQERSSQAVLVTYNCEQVPEKASESLKPPRGDAIKECIEKLKRLFDERPIYLKTVLTCITNFSSSILKDALPYVAYYFTTGPWRCCWVRFGYDPRKSPDAKMYQMIDYRLRYYAEPMVKAKPRSSYHKRKFRPDLNENEAEDYKNFKIEEDMYKFKADKMPFSRNVLYQLCDIEDDDIQRLINSDENYSNRCTEKDGWCSNNIQDKCRNIMSKKHEKLAKTMNIESKRSL